MKKIQMLLSQHKVNWFIPSAFSLCRSHFSGC